MHAAKYIVYAEIGHQDGEECKEHVQMIVFRGLQELDRFMVQRYGIDEQGDECPHFFRVPAPVSAPRDVCPYGTEEDADGEKEYSCCEKMRVGKWLMMVEKVPYRYDGDGSKQSVGNDDCDDMQV